MAIKLGDIYELIFKEGSATNQDPGSKAMAAAAQAATPPGGIPLPKPIDQEDSGDKSPSMIPEEKLEAEREKLEMQRRAELEKKENEIRGLQHELDLEKVERQKAVAENTLKEKERAQLDKINQEKAKLDEERNRLAQEKALQDNMFQAELIKHQADMERATSEQIAEVAQNKAKAVEDIAKQNAQQYIQTMQQSRKDTDKYFYDRQKQIQKNTPVMSTALQNQMQSAIASANKVMSHHKKFASFLPIPGSIPIIKSADYQFARPNYGNTQANNQNQNREGGRQGQFVANPTVGGYNSYTRDGKTYHVARNANGSVPDFQSSQQNFVEYNGQYYYRDPSSDPNASGKDVYNRYADINNQWGKQQQQQQRQQQQQQQQQASNSANAMKGYTYGQRAQHLATEYGMLNQAIRSGQNVERNKARMAQINKEMAALRKEVNKARSSAGKGTQAAADIAEYDLLNQKKKQRGRMGWGNWFQRQKDKWNKGSWWDKASLLSPGNWLFSAANEAFDNSTVELSDLERMKNGGGIVDPNSIEDNWLERNVGAQRALNGSWVGAAGDRVIGTALGGIGYAADALGFDETGKSLKKTFDDAWSGNTNGTLTGNLVGGFGSMATGLGIDQWDEATNQKRSQNFMRNLSDEQRAQLMDKYNISSNPYLRGLGDAALSAAMFVPGAGLAAGAARAGRAAQMAANGVRLAGKPYVFLPAHHFGIGSGPFNGRDFYSNSTNQAMATGRNAFVNDNGQVDYNAMYESSRGNRDNFMGTLGNEAGGMLWDEAARGIGKSASYIPLPGACPIVKVASIDDSYFYSPQGRNIAFGHRQVLSPYFKYDPFNHNGVTNWIGKFAPTIEMLTNGIVRFNPNTSKARFNNSTVDYKSLMTVASNPMHDPYLRRHYGSKHINSTSRDINDVLRSKPDSEESYGRNVTYVPTASSNIHA